MGLPDMPKPKTQGRKSRIEDAFQPWVRGACPTEHGRYRARGAAQDVWAATIWAEWTHPLARERDHGRPCARYAA